MNSINKNGCSVCQTGKENYCTYNTKLRGKKVRMYQYDYRHENGELFACCAFTLEECRQKRNKWLSDKYNSEWISAKEKLPNFGEKVLVITNSELILSTYTDNYEFVKYGTSNDVLRGVTHWMPIVKPKYK